MYAVEVINISKKYNLNSKNRDHLTLRDLISHGVKGAVSAIKGFVKSDKDFWALKDINFAVLKGESLGIIGSNGAGKSTLLKIISRITTPTEGKIITKGRVASLLEVGTGFHPELSGRENIYLNGVILGMINKEVKKKFDEIVAFSGVEKFLEMPVKYYSSGMRVRLAFAVASHLEPEILLIDEVLAVGDAEFQRKCLGKLNEITKKEGRTILFISHNMDAIKKNCQKAILLHEGRLVKAGNSEEVISDYLANIENFNVAVSERKDRLGAGHVTIEELNVTNQAGEKEIKSYDQLKIRLRLDKNFKKFKFIQVFMGVYDSRSKLLFRFNSDLLNIADFKSDWIEAVTDSLNLAPQYCYLNVSIYVDNIKSDHIYKAYFFKVHNQPNLKNVDTNTAIFIIKSSFNY